MDRPTAECCRPTTERCYFSRGDRLAARVTTSRFNQMWTESPWRYAATHPRAIVRHDARESYPPVCSSHCDRASNGGYNSLERLDRERLILFSTPFSFGQRRLRQEVQTEALCLGLAGPVLCVQN